MGRGCGPYSLSHPGPGLNMSLPSSSVSVSHQVLPPLPPLLLWCYSSLPAGPQPSSPARPSFLQAPNFVTFLSAVGLAGSSSLLLFTPSPNCPIWLQDPLPIHFLLDNSYFFHLFNKYGSGGFRECQVLGQAPRISERTRQAVAPALRGFILVRRPTKKTNPNALQVALQIAERC